MTPERHPAAVAAAISSSWRPYRWRAYAVALLAGLVAGEIAAPIATTGVVAGIGAHAMWSHPLLLDKAVENLVGVQTVLPAAAAAPADIQTVPDSLRRARPLAIE